MVGKQLYIDSFGRPEEVIKIRERQPRNLLEGEILVEMIVAPINPSDLIPVTGAYAHRTPLPSLLGYEGVGIVRKVCDENDTHLIGKRVLPLRGEGTWQEFVITRSEYAIQVPDEINDRTASQCYINPITAWVLCTEVFSLKKGSYLLVNASNSSIGKSLVQLSKILDFKVISVIRDEKDRFPLEELGAFFIINSTNENVRDMVMALTNGIGVEGAVDSIGGEEGTMLAHCVQKDGIFRTIGLLSGEQVDWRLLQTTLPISAELFHLRHWIDSVSIEAWQQAFASVFTYLKSGVWQLPEPASSYPLTEYKEALIMLHQANRKGKIMLQCNSGKVEKLI